jgi:8-oxo-dGTP pyrophosphatase MutT (NUDIX family)
VPHIHEKIDFTVEVFIVYKNKVLLRLHEKYKIWLSVGGHVELDEEPNQAAVREVKEEVGLDIQLVDDLRPFVSESDEYKELIPPRFMNMNRISPTHQHVTLTYFAKTDNDWIKPEKPDDKWKWVTLEELEGMDLRPSIKYYAKKAIDDLAVTS